MDKKLFLMIGMISIIAVLVLGCVTQTTNEYVEETTVEQEQEPVTTQAVVEKEEVVETPVQEFASAQDWYNIAKEEALDWRTDAKLVEVRGDNKEDRTYFEVDGTTNEWEYIFVSVPLLTKYKVTVSKGEITDTQEIDDPLAKMTHEHSKGDEAWYIDSTGAVDIVNTKRGGEDYLESNNRVKANYIYKSEGLGSVHVYWTISYFPEGYGQNLITNINAETGSLM